MPAKTNFSISTSVFPSVVKLIYSIRYGSYICQTAITKRSMTAITPTNMKSLPSPII